MYQLKPLIISSLYHLKLFDILRQCQRKRVIILMYHRFSQKPEPFKIQQSVFENQIKFLEKKYNFISLKHYSEVLNGKRDDLPNNPLIITIDDGYQDNYIVAFPILKKYSLPATIFITTNFINNKSWLWFDKLKYILKYTKKHEFQFLLGGNENKFIINNPNTKHNAQLEIFSYCKRLTVAELSFLLEQLSKTLNIIVPASPSDGYQPLTWSQIQEMQSNNIDFGAHTCSHPILSRLSHDELYYEIISSKKQIESKLGNEVYSFCYPVGQKEDINQEVVEITQKAGYSCAVTAMPGSNYPIHANKFLLNRISIGSDDAVKLSKILVRS